MKKLFALLVFAASITIASAQTQPAKSTAKAETKKVCKKGDKCCSMESKAKTASTETKSKTVKKD